MMKQKILKNHVFVLGSITLVNLAWLFIRNTVEGNTQYNFLLWNLFLGFLPLLFAWLLYWFSASINKTILLLGSLPWLLFYPNAPYMISDLIHVDAGTTTVLYDTLIIFSISMLSVFYGFFSLKLIFELFRDQYGTKIAHLVILLSLFLSSLGIYIGRILRINSWDVFNHPLKVFHQVIDHLFPVSKNPSTYVVIILFWAIQYFLLIMTKDLDDLRRTDLVSKKPSE